MSDDKINEIRALIVENDHSFIDIMEFYFSKSDVEITTETTIRPENVLKKIQTSYYDIIISEYELNGKMNGIELMKQVKQELENIPFIIYTNNYEAKLEEKALLEGVAAFIQKESGERCQRSLIQKMKREVKAYRAQQEQDIADRALDFTPDLMLFFDKEGQIVKCNKSFLEEMGVSKSDIEGKNILDIFESINLSNPEEMLEKTTEKDKINPDKDIGLKANKYSFRATPIADREIVGVIGIQKENIKPSKKVS